MLGTSIAWLLVPDECRGKSSVNAIIDLPVALPTIVAGLQEEVEVADDVVVMHRGRVEQTGGPRELYDKPANEFVMAFVGQANRMGNASVRPHDFQLTLELGDATARR